MPSFGQRSRERLETLCPHLQRVLGSAIQVLDFSVIEGLRTQERQEYYLKVGRTTTMKSKHVPPAHLTPGERDDWLSQAVDVQPYPPPRDDRQESYRWSAVAYLIIGIAHSLGWRFRWGGNWDMDNEIFTDQSFQDWFHIECLECRLG